MKGNYRHVSPFELALFFRPHHPMDLLIHQRDASAASAFFPCQIEQISENCLTLRLEPVDGTKLSLLEPGTVITLFSGQTHGSYAFKSKIIDVNRTTQRLNLEMPTLMWSEERRDDPRIPIAIPATYRLLQYHNLDLEKLTTKIGIGATDNLSRNGLSLITELLLPVGLTLALQFELEQHPFAAIGSVQRTRSFQTVQPGYATGIKFLEPSPLFQETLTETLQRTTRFLQQRILM